MKPLIKKCINTKYAIYSAIFIVISIIHALTTEQILLSAHRESKDIGSFLFFLTSTVQIISSFCFMAYYIYASFRHRLLFRTPHLNVRLFPSKSEICISALASLSHVFSERGSLYIPFHTHDMFKTTKLFFVLLFQFFFFQDRIDVWVLFYSLLSFFGSFILILGDLNNSFDLSFLINSMKDYNNYEILTGLEWLFLFYITSAICSMLEQSVLKSNSKSNKRESFKIKRERLIFWTYFNQWLIFGISFLVNTKSTNEIKFLMGRQKIRFPLLLFILCSTGMFMIRIHLKIVEIMGATYAESLVVKKHLLFFIPSLLFFNKNVSMLHFLGFFLIVYAIVKIDLSALRYNSSCYENHKYSPLCSNEKK